MSRAEEDKEVRLIAYQEQKEAGCDCDLHTELRREQGRIVVELKHEDGCSLIRRLESRG